MSTPTPPAIFTPPTAAPQTPAAVFSKPAGSPQSPAAVFAKPAGSPQTPAAVFSKPAGSPQSPAAVFAKPSGSPQTPPAVFSKPPVIDPIAAHAVYQGKDAGGSLVISSLLTGDLPMSLVLADPGTSGSPASLSESVDAVTVNLATVPGPASALLGTGEPTNQSNKIRIIRNDGKTGKIVLAAYMDTDPFGNRFVAGSSYLSVSMSGDDIHVQFDTGSGTPGFITVDNGSGDTLTIAGYQSESYRWGAWGNGKVRIRLVVPDGVSLFPSVSVINADGSISITYTYGTNVDGTASPVLVTDMANAINTEIAAQGLADWLHAYPGGAGSFSTSVEWQTMAGGVDAFLDFQNTNNTLALIAAAIATLTGAVASATVAAGNPDTILYQESTADFVASGYAISTTLADLKTILQTSRRIRGGSITNGATLCEAAIIELTGGAGLLPPPEIM